MLSLGPHHSADLNAGSSFGFAASTTARPAHPGAAQTMPVAAWGNPPVAERRQFGSSHAELSPAAREIAVAIDQYKLAACRRYITCEEILAVMTQLGYQRQSPS